MSYIQPFRTFDAGFSCYPLGVVLFPGFQVMNLAPLTAFEFANLQLGQDFYDVTFLSEAGRPVRTSIGMVIETEPFSDRRFDTIIVVGAIQVDPSAPGLIERLRETAATARRVAATCTGAFLCRGRPARRPEGSDPLGPRP